MTVEAALELLTIEETLYVCGQGLPPKWVTDPVDRLLVELAEGLGGGFRSF